MHACLCAQLCLAPCDPLDYSPPGSSALRQEYWSVLPFLSPGDLPDPGTELTSPASGGGFFTAEPLGKPGIKKRTLKARQKDMVRE